LKSLRKREREREREGGKRERGGRGGRSSFIDKIKICRDLKRYLKEAVLVIIKARIDKKVDDIKNEEKSTN